MSPRSLFAVVLGALAGPGRDEVTFARSYVLEFELVTSNFTLTGSENGESHEKQGPRVRRSESEMLETRDRCEDAADPLARFEREYETVASRMSYEGPDQEPDEQMVTAGLEGKSVRFVREDEGEWSRTTDAKDVNERQLARLRADLGLGVFLPEELPAVGTSWELDYATFERLVGPLGPVGARMRRGAGAGRAGLDVAPSALVEPLWLLLAKAEGSATFARVEPEEGAELPALAEVEFRFEAEYDGAKHVLRGREAETSDRTTTTWSGSGTLAFDPAAGALVLTLDGELALEERFTIAFEANATQAEVVGELSCAGRFEVEARETRE